MRTLCFLFLFVVLNCGCNKTNTNLPISFRHVKTGEFNNKGYVSSGTIFWATNHTSNTVAISIAAIEVKNGTNWVVASRPVQPLLFKPPGKPIAEHFLGPHIAGYATIQLTKQSAGTTWRARVYVQPLLSGFADTATRVKHTPEFLQRRMQTGDTNIPVNLFATNMFFGGKSTEVVSQDILEK